jgi:hypothetical protein
MAILISLSQTSFAITAQEAKRMQTKSCKQLHYNFYKEVVEQLIPEAASKGKNSLWIASDTCAKLYSYDIEKLHKLGYTLEMYSNGDVQYVNW